MAGAYRTVVRTPENCHGLIVAPTYRMLMDFAWPAVRRWAMDLDILAEEKVGRMAIYLSTGATLYFRSADKPDSLRGLTVANCWLDEASLMGRDVFDTVRFCVREINNGWIAATFTPKGTKHWTYKEFGPDRGDCEFVHARSFDNPFLPADFIEELRKTDPGPLAQQEIYGMFVDIEGVEWPSEFWGDWVFVDTLPNDLDVRVIAVDPSLGKSDRQGDYSAIVFVGIGRGLIWVDANLERRSPAKIVSDTIRYCNQYNPHFVGIEANQFQELLVHEFERQTQGQFAVKWPTFKIVNRTPKLVRIRRLGQYIVRRELRVKRNPGGLELVGELQEFPHGAHDDGPDALEMALRLIMEVSGGRISDEYSTTESDHRGDSVRNELV